MENVHTYIHIVYVCILRFLFYPNLIFYVRNIFFFRVTDRRSIEFMKDLSYSILVSYMLFAIE